MKRLLIALPLVVAAHATDPQPPLKATKLAMDCVGLDWMGVDGRTYFVQASANLETWFYLGIIEPGETDFEHGYGMACDSEKLFWRLRWSDIATTDPDAEDFDNDGLSNRFEVTYGLDPLDDDVDDDSTLDGAEDGDQDGSLNTTEQSGGRDPRVKDHPDVKLSVVVAGG